MNKDRERKIRRFISRARIPYRIIIASLAAGTAFTSIALHASEVITPEAIENAALYSVLTRMDDSSQSQESDLPETDGRTSNDLYKSEITHIEDGAQNDGEPADADGGESGAGEGDDGVYPITHLDISGQPAAGELLMSNSETSYTPDLYDLYSSGYPIEKDSSPCVLIIHTHATEAYSDGSGYYTDETSFRSSDPAQTVVAVGSVMAQELEAAGIRCIHCEVMHDAEDFNKAYDRACESILSYLEKYPEIQYIIDVHRDAIIRGDGEMIAPTVETKIGQAAQVMLVIGTDEYGADHPRWRDNLNIACKLQNTLNSEFNFARPINLRGASFNEQYRAGSMLVEVGSSGNTLDEAKLAGRLFARALAQLITSE